ncbi:kinesin light chain, partial [Lindgomyces ingoldianus]
VIGNEHPDALGIVNNIARSLRDQGKHVEAEKMHREISALREKIFGEEHPDMMTSNAAGVLKNQGKYTKTEKMHHEALALQEKMLRNEHP